MRSQRDAGTIAFQGSGRGLKGTGFPGRRYFITNIMVACMQSLSGEQSAPFVASKEMHWIFSFNNDSST